MDKVAGKEVRHEGRERTGQTLAYVHIEDWRNRPLQGGRYPYVYVNGSGLPNYCRIRVIISSTRIFWSIRRIRLEIPIWWT